MKTIAMPVVSLVRKFPAPLLPKMVELEPPNTAPISAPLPVWSSTTKMSPILTRTWMIVTMVNMVFSAKASTYDLQKLLRFQTRPAYEQPVDPNRFH